MLECMFNQYERLFDNSIHRCWLSSEISIACVAMPTVIPRTFNNRHQIYNFQHDGNQSFIKIFYLEHFIPLNAFYCVNTLILKSCNIKLKFSACVSSICIIWIVHHHHHHHHSSVHVGR